MLIHVFSPSLMRVMQIPCCPLICWGLVMNVVNDSSKETLGEVNISGKTCCFFHVPVPVEGNYSLLFEVSDRLFKGEDQVLVSC